MRAMVVRRGGEPLALEDRPLPEPGPGEVRVRVNACGVCRSDLWITRGEYGGLELPRIPGHEVAGTVDALGDSTGLFSIGDRVGIGWHGGHCGRCRPCREGDMKHCESARVCGASYDGGYAEAVVAPEHALAPIPDGMAAADAAPLMCAGITTFNALRHAGGRPGDLAIIEGIGGLGHLGLQFANKMGFEVVAVNRTDVETEARELGAHHFIDSSATDPATRLREMGGAAVILATSPDADSMSNLVRGLGRYGRLVIVGVPTKLVAVDAGHLIDTRAAVSGWDCGHAEDSADTLAFAARNGIRPRIETFPLEEANEALAAMNEGRVRFRAVLDMEAPLDSEHGRS